MSLNNFWVSALKFAAKVCNLAYNTMYLSKMYDKKCLFAHVTAKSSYCILPEIWGVYILQQAVTELLYVRLCENIPKTFITVNPR